jgi:hypothetical protein
LQSGNPKHNDLFHLRKNVKISLRENCKLFLEKEIIDKWEKDSPMSARKIEDAGTCAQAVEKKNG